VKLAGAMDDGTTRRLRDTDLGYGYDSADDALRRFYVPALSRSVEYDRSVGYFRASAFKAAAVGLSRFIAGGGTARFLCGAEIAESDREAMSGALTIPDRLAQRLADELLPADEIAEKRLAVIAWLVREGRLQIRIAVALDPNGEPVPPGTHIPYFHEKLGVLRDADRDGVAFIGSINESETAWTQNFESFSVFRSWDGTAPHFDFWSAKFTERWNGHIPGFRVFNLPDAAEQKLLSFAVDKPPPDKDPEEPDARAPTATVAQFLIAAPRLIGAEGLAEATSGVTLFPHQRKVVERLAGEYPRSWLVADEVGLGKTISAGLALRRLLLTGSVERALILAPANVCRQWQDELFERFGLWVPRLDGGKIHGAHPDDVTSIPPGTNPYADNPVLLVSSHLARIPRHRQEILAAARLDLLIVDEAHHARRRAADLDEYRPSRLLQLLDEVTRTDHAKATWLLTATPMQVHPIELSDLLRHVGLSGALDRFSNFERFHSELAKSDDDAIAWAWLASMLVDTPSLPFDPADRAMLEQIDRKLGHVHRERIERFGRPGEDPSALVDALSSEGRRELRVWLRQRGPVGQYVTRHSRETLKRYRDRGLLLEPIADRDVAAIPVQFTREEKTLYEQLDALLDRLMQAHGTKRGAGFVLNIYRRRLTSSWEAIKRTFERRLARERLALELDLLSEDEADELDTSDGSSLDDTQAVPLTDGDLAEIEAYLGYIDALPTDSKFDRLQDDLNDARGSGKPIIVFTQFTDTLTYLRDRLRPAYRSHLATYTGAGGAHWQDDEGWVGISKQELVEALRSGRVSVVLATDAASEGLNLQAASRLICYDLPYNPMRVEQRIGRIDRIGQPEPVVVVRNYVIPGTVEESVYAALSSRIDIFSGLVGKLQPILGATEAAFARIFRVPRSERAAAQSAAIAHLLTQVDELERSGIDLSDEDPMPTPNHRVAPVSLESLDRCLIEDLDISLDGPGRPATREPSRASRDREHWTALATYGHPALTPALQTAAETGPSYGSDALVLREHGRYAVAYRADRSPPLRVETVNDLADLGDAVAAGEADETARRVLDEFAKEKQKAGDALTAASRERWERQIRQRFRQLVNTAIRADQSLRMRAEGEAPEPNLVWFSFGTGSDGWQHAERFRAHLRLPLDELLPRGGPGADDRSERDLRRVREQAGRDLVDLVKEWRVVALAPESS
jgi:superfamily II DNA or RNA helicase